MEKTTLIDSKETSVRLGGDNANKSAINIPIWTGVSRTKYSLDTPIEKGIR